MHVHKLCSDSIPILYQRVEMEVTLNFGGDSHLCDEHVEYHGLISQSQLLRKSSVDLQAKTGWTRLVTYTAIRENVPLMFSVWHRPHRPLWSAQRSGGRLGKDTHYHAMTTQPQWTFTLPIHIRHTWAKWVSAKSISCITLWTRILCHIVEDKVYKVVHSYKM